MSDKKYQLFYKASCNHGAVLTKKVGKSFTNEAEMDDWVKYSVDLPDVWSTWLNDLKKMGCVHETSFIRVKDGK